MPYLGNSLSVGSSAVTASASALAPFTNTYSVDFTTDDYVDITSVLSSVATDTQGAFSAWVAPTDATPVSSTIIIGFGDNDADNRLYYNITEFSPAGRLIAVCRINGVTQWILGTDAAITSDDTWVSVILSHNGTEPVLYVNGVAVAQTFTNTTDKTAWLNDIPAIDIATVGMLRYSSQSRNFFEGLIDEPAIFSTALTSQQALAIGSNPPADLTSYSPVGWWRFEEGTGTSITDSSGNGHTATLTNGPTFSTDVPT